MRSLKNSLKKMAGMSFALILVLLMAGCWEQNQNAEFEKIPPERYEEELKKSAKSLFSGTAEEQKKAFELLRYLAEKNFMLAQEGMGAIYGEGHRAGVAIDYKESLKWFHKAETQGSAFAAHEIGVSYAEGKGIERNPNEAEKWLRLAMQRGRKESACALAYLFFEWQKPIEEIFSLIQSNEGSQNCQYLEGLIYLKGYKNIAQNDTKAFSLFEKADKNGSLEAKYMLGLMYLNGKGFHKNEAFGMELITQAADKGLQSARFFLGEKNKSLSEKEVTEYLQYLAKKGYKNANCDLAYKFVEWKKPIEEVLFLLEETEELGRCQYLQGRLYIEDYEGIEKNEAKALLYFEKAAKNGIPEAKFVVGKMNVEGLGTPKNQARGILLIQEAAKDGVPEAISYLESNMQSSPKEE